MKILNFTKFYDPYVGGIETVVKNMTVSNIAKGYQSDVLCSNTNFSSDIENMGGAKVIRSPKLLTLKSTSICPLLPIQFKNIMNDYDLIHVHFPDPMSALSLFLARPSKPFVIHWHSDIIKQKRFMPFFEPLQDWCLHNASAIIVTSPNYAEHSLQLKKFQNKIHVVPIGIDANQEFKNKKLSSENKNILSVGRLTDYKGFRYLVEASLYLPDNFHITIVGDGENKQELIELVKKLKVSDKVSFVGSLTRESLDKCFNYSDPFCLASTEKSEAFGVVLIEAMASSLPIVATNIPGSGVPWVNQHLFSGINVSPKDPKELAKAICQILEEPTLYKQFSLNSYNRYKAEFRLEKMMESIWTIYGKVKA